MNEKERFERWLHNHFNSKGFNVHPWDAWQAALSTRKAYGYGIVDKDGKEAVSVLLTEGEAKSYTATFQVHSPEKEFNVVALFYEDSES